MAERKVIKLTVNLPEAAYEELKSMAREQNTTVTETLRRSISTEKFLRDAVKEGSKVLLEDPGKKYRQILLR
jgi:hypothetical protein